MTEKDIQCLVEILEELFRRIQAIEKRIKAVPGKSGTNPERTA